MTSAPIQSLKNLGWAAVTLLSAFKPAPATRTQPNPDTYFHVTETTTGPLGSSLTAIVSNVPFTRAARQMASAQAVPTLRVDQLIQFDFAGSPPGMAARPGGVV